METNRSFQEGGAESGGPRHHSGADGLYMPGRAVHGSAADSVCVNKESAGSLLLFPNCHHLLRFRQDIPEKSRYSEPGKI